MIAEFESCLIKMRTREGMQVAKAKGRLRGKEPRLNPKQEAHLVELHAVRQHATGEFAELFAVARSTSIAPCNAPSKPAPAGGPPDCRVAAGPAGAANDKAPAT